MNKLHNIVQLRYPTKTFKRKLLRKMQHEYRIKTKQSILSIKRIK